MTADTTAGGHATHPPAAGAPAHDQAGRPAIAWPAAYHTVRRLQARIVQATQEGRGGKGNALHHRLTHSCSGKAMAVKRVTDKQGQHTPGVERDRGHTPEQQREAMLDLRHRGDRPSPRRRGRRPTRNGTRRPLGIPTMRERALQALSRLALEPIAETTAAPHSSGCRKDRSPADAMMQCSSILARQGSAQGGLEGDVTSCCDTRSPDGLRTHVPIDKGVLWQWFKAGSRETQAFHPTEAGTPQGGLVTLPTKWQICW
jgi:RNA-directed DNA polymerase